MTNRFNFNPFVDPMDTKRIIKKYYFENSVPTNFVIWGEETDKMNEFILKEI